MAILDHLWTVVLCAWFASELVIGIGTRTRNRSGSVRDRGTLPLLWVVIFSSISICFWYRAVHGPSMPGAADAYRFGSLALLILGVAFRWAAVLSLGKAFSSNVAIRSGQTVRTTGFYRWMRHPSYSATLICFLAIGIHTCNWISFLIVTVSPTAAFFYRIHVEETALREHFGAEYVEYSRRTKRLVPGIY